MRDICKIALRLTILMVIAGFCLGAAYTVTKDPIARQEAEQKEMARKAVLEEAVSFEEVQLTDGGNVQECYRGLDAAGNPCGYAMSVTAKGFGGRFSGIITDEVLYEEKPQTRTPEEYEAMIADIKKATLYEGAPSEECIAACPCRAISKDGIDRFKCQQHCRTLNEYVPSADACGKCFFTAK